jgi:hypothetical protein
MASNIANLNQHFQVVSQFVAARASHYRGLGEINQEIVNIAPLFNGRQLPLQIFSQFPLLSDGLKNFFYTHPGFRQFYNSKVLGFPINSTVTATNCPPTLILKANSTVGQVEVRYELSSSKRILLGRDLQHQNDAKQLHIPLPLYKKVSGRHAEIQSVSSIGSAVQSWQICDLNSTNGTYINGQKIKGCQILTPSDKITLSYPTASEKSPEFVLEGQLNASTTNPSSSNQVDADLIFLVIHPTQTLSASEKQLIEQVSRASAFGFVIVADISGTKPQDSPSIKANLDSIRSWIQNQYPQLAASLELIELFLYPFYPNIPSAPLTPAIEQQFVQFAAPFIDLAKNQGAELIANRINQQLQVQIQKIDQILSSQEEALKHEIQRTEASLNGRTLESWRDHCNRIRKQTDEARDDFFREARTQFFRARDEFSTDFIPNSLIQKVDAFISSLEPGVTKLNDQVCIQFQSSDGQDLHTFMIIFCQTELTQWGNQQWKKIRCEIDGDGLEGLLRKTYTQLNCLPEFQLTNAFGISSTQIGFSNHFQTTFSEVKTDISYSESSGNAFGGIAKIAMLTATTAISAVAHSPYAIIQGANTLSAWGGLIGGSLSRPQQEKLKLEQVVDSLRRASSNHYRNIARYLINRVAQEISSAIDAEERRFRKARDTTDEQMRGYFIELENILRGYRTRQEILYKDRLAFDQIKRLGG